MPSLRAVLLLSLPRAASIKICGIEGNFRFTAGEGAIEYPQVALLLMTSTFLGARDWEADEVHECYRRDVRKRMCFCLR